MGKRFDVKNNQMYCDTMADAYASYAQAADCVQLQCVNFFNNPTFTGRQAVATKEMVGVGEVNLIHDILDVNNRIRKAQDDVMEMFAAEVDAATNALIDEDVLMQMDAGLKRLYNSFDQLGRRVEQIYARLQKFSKYGSFTRPDFNTGRNAAIALCGGNGVGGYISQCRQKLIDYDASADAMLAGLGLEDEMHRISNRLASSSSVMCSYLPYSAARGMYNAYGVGLRRYGNGTLNPTIPLRGNSDAVTVMKVSQKYYPSYDDLFPDLANDGSINDGFGDLSGHHNIRAVSDKPKSAAEQRQEDGFWKTAGGIGLMALGAFCIIVTGGAATPLVIGGGIIGGGTIAFGAADAIEGGSDIYYGSLGDIESASVNPLRDTVFQGNEAAYRTTENLFAFTASSMIPIGQMARAGDLTLRTGGVAVGKLVASDAAGQVASNYVYEVTGDRVLSLAAGSLTSGVTGKGLNKLDARYGWSYGLSRVPHNNQGIIDVEADDIRQPNAGNVKDANNKSITPVDKNRIDKWKYRPDDDLYLDNKAVFDNPKYYNQETGEINWPPNNGAVEGTTKQVVLDRGTQIDRFGDDSGYYTSPVNTPYEQRSVAPGTNLKPYNQFEVIEPIKGVEQGRVAPWFDQPGGGTQYLMPESIEDLIEDGFLRRK